MNTKSRVRTIAATFVFAIIILFANAEAARAQSTHNASVTNGASNQVYEIMRISRDSANWSQSGYEITVRNTYYNGGGIVKAFVGYGYQDSGTVTILEAAGQNQPKIFLGSEVVVSGTIKYIPVNIQVPAWQYFSVEVKFGTTETTSITAASQVQFTGTSTTTGATGANHDGSVNFAGNVGIGTTSPLAKLNVQADAVWPTDVTNAQLILSGATNSNKRLVAGFDTTSNFGYIAAGTSGTGWNNLSLQPSGGNVGIGTTSPAEKLDVAGTLRATGQSAAPSSGAGVEVSYASGVGYIQSYDRSVGDKKLYLSGSQLYLNGDGQGSVGIGTTSPLARLHVGAGTDTPNLSPDVAIYASNAGTTYISARDSTNHVETNFGSYSTAGIIGTRTNHPLYLQANAGNAMAILANGNVGIGTTSPLAKFHVEGVASTYAGYFHGNSASGQSLGVLIDAGANTSDYPFRVRSYNSVDYFAVRGDGNVGIGTTSPGQKLDVVGNINVSGSGAGNITLTGTINAKYQDVAEWVPSSEKLSPGTVVVLDSTKSNQVTSSTTSYDTRVAGVVSEQPGIALGEKSDSKALVATTGRVRVKVDASKGAVHIGDLLVTSDVPGVAMKSEPVNLGGVQFHRPGTLIGKALEPLEKGKGAILVLLSLQ